MRKFYVLILIIFTLLAQDSFAQYILKGKLTDETGAPSSFTTINIKDQSYGARTTQDGNFEIKLQEAGTYVVQIRALNFNEILDTIVINTPEVTKNYVLYKKNNEVKSIVVKAERSRETESALLMDQKKQVVIEEKIGAKELTKQGVSDAEGAVAKISGISKSENNSGNGSVFVRGLGDRYLSTTLNGLLVPSESPELKNISLSLFPTDIIQNVGVSKTFNRNLLGDFAGAGIDIATKEYNGKFFITPSIKVGFNSQAIDNSVKSIGMNLWGTPANKNFYTDNLSSYQFSSVNWSPLNRKLPNIDRGISVSLGSSKRLAHSTFGFYANGMYNVDFGYQNGFSGNVIANGSYLQKYDQAITSSTSITKQAMVSGYWKNDKNAELNLNYLYMNKSDEVVKSYYGVNTDLDPDKNTYITRGTQEQNILNSIQLLGKTKISERVNLNGGMAVNFIDGTQPQRITNMFIEDKPGAYRLSTSAGSNNNLFWQKSTENQIQVKAGVDINVSKSLEGEKESKLYIGINAFTKNKDFSAYQYNFKPLVTPVGVYNPDNIDEFFNASKYSSKEYTVSFLGSRAIPNKFNGTIKNGGFIVDYSAKFGPKTTLNFGVKNEFIAQDVNWDVSKLAAKIPQGSTQILSYKPLPYANLKLSPSEKINLKFGASKTYTMPQFKELAPFLYENVIVNTFGNPFLYASDNYNVDAKFELFPAKSEIISVTAFSKYIANPINKTMMPSSANEMSYANTGDFGTVSGLEFEFRKDLNRLFHLPENQNLNFGVNFSVLTSYQQLSNTKIFDETKGYLSGNFTFDHSTLTGASPFIFNSDISYSPVFGKVKPTITLAGNYFADRLYSVGLNGIGNNYEKGYFTMDIIGKLELSNKFNLGLNFKNITNPNITIYQQVLDQKTLEVTNTALSNQYKRGTNCSLSLTYKF